MSDTKAKFVEGNLWRHVSVMAFTASVGLMAMFAVDFVDMIFISMLGNAALAAAVGYAGTFLFFTNSVNIGLSIAAGTLVAKAVGAEKRDDAAEYATSVAIYGVLTSIAIVAVCYPTLPIILSALGAEGEVLDLAVRYVRFILPTMPIMSVAIVCMAVLRGNGDARRSMMATLIGGIVNAVLDPFLIFGLDLGLDGAALASIGARFTMLYVALMPSVRIYNGLTKPSVQLAIRDLHPVSIIAFPAVMTSLATPFGSAIVTREIAAFGTDAIAGMAIIGRLTPVAFAVILALSGAIGPIIGQNLGAGKFERIRTAFLVAIGFTGLYVLIVTGILFAARGTIANLFNASGETLDLLYLFCGPLALASFFNGVIFIANASFNNLGRPIYATLTNWGRHSLGTWPFAVYGAQIAGASGVLIGQALGGVVFAVIALAVALRVIANAPAEAEPDAFHEHSRLHHLSLRAGPK